jgi:hypothetical protein
MIGRFSRSRVRVLLTGMAAGRRGGGLGGGRFPRLSGAGVVQRH